MILLGGGVLVLIGLMVLIALQRNNFKNSENIKTKGQNSTKREKERISDETLTKLEEIIKENTD